MPSLARWARACLAVVVAFQSGTILNAKQVTGNSRIHEEELGGFDQAFPEVARPGRKCLDKKNGLKQIKISAQGAVGAEREWSFL